MSNFFFHPVFKDAIADIESLGLKVYPNPTIGAKPYAVVGGRSNSRWWLIPLENGMLTVSGFALFQPLLTSARILKSVASLLSFFGLTRLWVRNYVYISGESFLSKYFHCGNGLNFAYFTGTDSPHRKVAVQIMDRAGSLKGFAKLSRNPHVRELLKHEAETLEHLNRLALESTYVPKMLFAGDVGNVFLLVTDTLKTSRTPAMTKFTEAHCAFIREILQKTTPEYTLCVGDIARGFRSRVGNIRQNIEEVWLIRLEAAISKLEYYSLLDLQVGLSHGDFTPWNTFMVKNRLYVFDWEYAELASPLSNDIIHFVLNQPQIRNLTIQAKIKAAFDSLMLPQFSIHQETIPAIFIIYLLTQSLRQIERLPISMKKIETWDGAEEAAAMFEFLKA